MELAKGAWSYCFAMLRIILAYPALPGRTEKPLPVGRPHDSETVCRLLNWRVQGQFDLYRLLHSLCALEVCVNV